MNLHAAKSCMLGALVATSLACAEFTFAQEANSVVFGDNGEVLGSYNKLSDVDWVELDNKGSVKFHFVETSRDSDTVHLLDQSRGVAITLDIANNVIAYGELGSPEQQPIFTIMEVKVAAVETVLAQTVAFGSNSEWLGTYVNSAPGVWYELDSRGTKQFTFTERARTPEKVSLEDASRGIALTLDLTGKKVTFGAIDDAEQQPLYEILESIVQQDAGADDSAALEPTVPIDTQAVQREMLAENQNRPSQIKLKHVGAYLARFTVTWIEGESGQPKSWESGEKRAPYFELVPLPRTAWQISIIGEGQNGTEWNQALNLTIKGPNNKCFVLSGTVNSQIWDASSDPSDSNGDDCP